jgi:hypothetical protein
MPSALPGVVVTGLEAWFIASDVQPEILTWLAIVEHNPAYGTSARRARINMPDEDLPRAPFHTPMQCLVHEWTALMLAWTVPRTAMISANFGSATRLPRSCAAHHSISVSGST